MDSGEDVHVCWVKSRVMGNEENDGKMQIIDVEKGLKSLPCLLWLVLLQVECEI